MVMGTIIFSFGASFGVIFGIMLMCVFTNTKRGA